MGPIETAVLHEIGEPTTTLECQAVKLAQLLDSITFVNNQKTISPATLNRELRETMKAIADSHPHADNDPLDDLVARNDRR